MTTTGRPTSPSSVEGEWGARWRTTWHGRRARDAAGAEPGWQRPVRLGRLGSHREPACHGAGRAAAPVTADAPTLPELAADLQERTGIDIGLTRPGSLRLAFDDRGRPDLESVIEQYAAVGYEAEWLDAQEVRGHRAGRLAASLRRRLRAGHYSLYAPHYVRAAAAGAAAHGAVVRQGVPVTGAAAQRGSRGSSRDGGGQG